MNESLRIAIDDRERNQDLLDVLGAMDGLDLECLRLDIGDFRINDAVLIERKTAIDFAASLIDGRLFSQASRLVQSPLRPAYIIEGTAEDWKSLKIKRHALQGALISLMLVFDIPVLRSNDPEETARLVVYASQQFFRAQSDGWIPTRQIKAKRRSTQQRRVLQSLPGIGPDRAKRLLEHFGSVRACLSANADELSTLPGFGPAIARKIVDTVEEEKTRYGDATKSDSPFSPLFF
ncbi:MAG: hypothetical protein JJT75_00755 [Opitutales bacterium]|nr:hypothetical protein [Opitutales bacterium]MCH8539921.1 hypothetical protein [Opitutales bacterium]